MEMSESVKQQKRYQWIKGDKFGNVVEVAENQKDSKWLYFSDGSRINHALINEFLIEIENDNQILNVNVKTTPSDNKKSTPKPKEPIIENNVQEVTVMGKMIEKMSKKNVVNVPVEINVNIPTPAIYAMLSEGMESEDLNEEIMSVALAQIEINKLQEYIKLQITNFLINYYG